MASDVFAEIIKNKRIPDTFTPLNVDEIGIPGHMPVVEMVLKQFGKHGTYTTEYNATKLPEADQVKIAARYKRAWEWQRQSGVGVAGLQRYYPLQTEKISSNPRNYSTRLHCLVLAHTPEWNEQNTAPVWTENSQTVYFFMSEILGPKLGFNFNSDRADRPGDYNLLVAWAFKNVETIKKLYLQKDDPKHIDTQLARGIGVVLNIRAFENLSDDLKTTVTSTPAETASKDKTLRPNVEQAVAPPTTIVKDFERWFVEPKQHEGLAGMGDLLSADILSAMGEQGADRYFDRLNFLSLLNLAILQDIPGKNEPLKRLDAKLGFGGKLPEILGEYLTVVGLAQDKGTQPEEVINRLNPIRSEWGNQSLASALRELHEEMSQGDQLGYGSGRAVLVQYNEEVRIKGNRETRMVQYMGMMVKMATDDGLLGIEKYKKEITG